MARFEVHWDVVRAPAAAGAPAAERAPTPGDTFTIALFPAPVNADACFEAAGFTDFDDADADWDAAADALCARILAWLARYGAVVQQGEPLRGATTGLWPWRRPGAVLALAEQVQQPMHWDNLPGCHLVFGHAGAALRTGQGHQLYWIDLPGGEATHVEELVRALAAPHPCIRTRLDWAVLRPGTRAH